MFAQRPYDDVSMEDVAARSGVSRALLYRHFPGKRELFAAMYQQASDRLLDQTVPDPGVPVAEQIAAGLDAYIDYFEANRNTALAASRTLAGDPIIQAILQEELDLLRQRIVELAEMDESQRRMVSAGLMGWLRFAHVAITEWLANKEFSRDQLRDMCLGALLGALGSVIDVSRPAGGADTPSS